MMRKPRKPETDKERSDRRDRAALTKIDETQAADDAVDEMIRKNIKLYGP